LQAQGWFVGHWAKEHGGQGWGHLQRFIFLEELEQAGTPWLAHFGTSFLGPVLLHFGNEAQRARFLGPIRESTEWWCQGFSEPGSGSDLASLKLRAERGATHYRVNGQKTWTTMAQWADWIFCLVRTQSSGRPQQGISFLLIDLKSPGVTVRPIATFDGGHHVNEVFFDDVEVPVDNLVGNEGDGWTIAKFIVSRERLLVTEIGKACHLLGELRALAADAGLCETPAFRRQFAELEVLYRTLRTTAYAAVLAAEAGREHAIDASLLKIRGSELQQAIHDAITDVLARGGLAFQTDGLNADLAGYQHGDARLPGLLHEHLHARAASIYGGSNEIQRGIIAKTALHI
jgi:alkylation response protein AidB-like acyl-CoA dehydrogenase